MTGKEREFLESVIAVSELHGGPLRTCLAERDAAIALLSDLTALVEMAPSYHPRPDCDLYPTNESAMAFLAGIREGEK